MTDIVTASVKGIVKNPTAAVAGLSTESQLAQAAHGQLQTANVHGQWFEANFRNRLFSYNVTAVQLPVVASGLVSVFTLYNPPDSNIVAELVSAQIGQVLVTTVVNDISWYSSSAVLTAAGTFTTLAQARSGRAQAAASNGVKPYSAYTHSGTPIREDIIATMGGITNPVVAVVQKKYDGELLLPPGIAMSVAASTATTFTAGTGIEATWAEWPAA